MATLQEELDTVIADLFACWMNDKIRYGTDVAKSEITRLVDELIIGDDEVDPTDGEYYLGRNELRDWQRKALRGES